VTRACTHAIVIGGNIAGCLAAEVLSRRFERVTLIEKGDFYDESHHRKSVPQEHHVHLLLLRGKQILETLFPGLVAELECEGAVEADLGHDVKWYQYGRWKQRYKTGVTAHYCSRRLLDNLIRRRIRGNPRVQVRSQTVVDDLLHADARVCGVRLGASGENDALAADLVIDASGRGSHALQWLEHAGYAHPDAKELVATKLGYASRIYRRQPQYRDLWKILLVLPLPPHQRSMGVISPIEGDRWLVTTGGWFGDFPKPDPDQFLAHLAKLPVPDIHRIVSEAEPLSEVFGFGMSGSLRRRFDLFPQWPEGFVVIGDALCSLNPLYSQGMSLCAMEADCLASRLDPWLAGQISAHQLQCQLLDTIDPAWGMAKQEDLRFPETAGRRSSSVRWNHWYGKHIGRLSALHRLTLSTQIEVSNLVAPGTRLYHPEIFGRVLLASLFDSSGRS
jgi:2-polyprenyl-6-methoxyphenol hydroxylase-like FAD-dependent oxidoreductase